MTTLMRVWDPLVRIAHWTLVAAIVTAWFTRHGGGRVHEWAGYAVLVIVAVRIAWGFSGPRYARFAQFVRAPAATLRYGTQVLTGQEPRHIGHNPLGGWMIVFLLVTALLTAGSGWLYTTDRFWGIEWVERTHLWLTYLLLALAALHITGAIVESVRHRENLIAAMFHGNKREAGPGDVR